MTLKNNKTILTASTIVLSLVLVMPMISQNVSAVSETTSAHPTPVPQMPVTPQENDPKIASIGKIAMQLVDKIKNAKTAQEKSLLEIKLDAVKKQMNDLGVPTFEQFKKDPQYWISKAKGYNNTSSVKNPSALSPLCACPYMQFENAYSYSCYGGLFACYAYNPSGFVSAYPGQWQGETLSIQTTTSPIYPFWLVSISGNNMGTNTWTANYKQPSGYEFWYDSGTDNVVIPWYSTTWTHNSLPPIYNPQIGGTIYTDWTVQHIP
jgi:hypothetical protein